MRRLFQWCFRESLSRAGGAGVTVALVVCAETVPDSKTVKIPGSPPSSMVAINVRNMS